MDPSPFLVPIPVNCELLTDRQYVKFWLDYSVNCLAAFLVVPFLKRHKQVAAHEWRRRHHLRLYESRFAPIIYSWLTGRHVSYTEKTQACPTDMGIIITRYVFVRCHMNRFIEQCSQSHSHTIMPCHVAHSETRESWTILSHGLELLSVTKQATHSYSAA